jgi:hypothetical protein
MIFMIWLGFEARPYFHFERPVGVMAEHQRVVNFVFALRIRDSSIPHGTNIRAGRQQSRQKDDVRKRQIYKDLKGYGRLLHL